MKIEEVREFVQNSLIKMINEGCIKNKCPSYFDIICYFGEDYFEEFQKDTLLKNIEKEKENVSFSEILGYYLLEDDIIQVLDILHSTLGNIQNIYTLSREVLDQIENNQVYLFYTIEDIIFLEFSSCCLCFIVGNND